MASYYLLFRQAAADHERLATLTGCVEHMGLAQELHRRAVEVRLASNHPPQKCIECRSTIAPEEMRCRSCGRARQGVRLTRYQIENLMRFFESYDFASAERILRAQENHVAKKRAAKARAWAARIGVDDDALLKRAQALGNMRLAVESFSPGAWNASRKRLQP